MVYIDISIYILTHTKQNRGQAKTRDSFVLIRSNFFDLISCYIELIVNDG